MRILFLGLNYAPEPIGIAVYSTGMCQYLVRSGHQVRAIVGKPYYPEWRIHEHFRARGTASAVEQGVELTRVPHYVPAVPTGGKRLLHHLSFALSALWPMLREARRLRPDVVLTVAPSLIAAPVARLAAALAGAKSWLHIQDFEVEAAFATGLVKADGIFPSLAKQYEQAVLRRFDRISSISFEMCAKASRLGVAGERIYELRNWADLDSVRPLERPSVYRQQWGITTPHVALYSGNIANKQGIEIVVDGARLLAGRRDLTFVICGQGPNRAMLEARAADLDNIQFHDLQPVEKLNELLGLATIHLLPQKASAADLVLPSKLTNMLASGRPVIATAASVSGLAREVEGCGRVVPPEDTEALASAIGELLDSPEEYARTSATARERAISAWDQRRVLADFTRQVEAVAKQGHQIAAAERAS